MQCAQKIFCLFLCLTNFKNRHCPNIVPGLALVPPPPPPPLSQLGASPMVSGQSTASVEKSLTVFVGKIPDDVEDDFIRLILQKCGTVIRWKRAVDGGVVKSFGYCDFAMVEDVERALRLLNKFQLGDKQLVVRGHSHNRFFISSRLTSHCPLLASHYPFAVI
jgi:hypothetical protein